MIVNLKSNARKTRFGTCACVGAIEEAIAGEHVHYLND
jgi:hypothetical protein